MSLFKRRNAPKKPIPVIILASPERVAEAENEIKSQNMNVKAISVSSPGSALEMVQSQPIVALIIDCSSLPTKTSNYAAQIEELILKAQIKKMQIIHIGCQYTVSPNLNMSSIYIGEAQNIKDAIAALSIITQDMQITPSHAAIVRKIIGLLSTKGGVGTTTNTIALSYFIARGGFSTVLVDASTTKGNITRYLYWSRLTDGTIDSDEVVRINDLLLFKENVSDEEYEENIRTQISNLPQIDENLYVIGGIVDPKDIESVEQNKGQYINYVEKLLLELHKYFDFVIMDLGNNLNSIFTQALNDVGGFFIFTSAPRIAAIDDTIDSVLGLHPQHAAVLVSQNSASDEMDPDEAIRAIRAQVRQGLPDQDIIFLPFVPLDSGLNLGIPQNVKTLKERLKPHTIKTFKNIARTIITAVNK